MSEELRQIRTIKSELPVVAFIGRPSVGKSTIFNRILRKNLVITDKTFGVTRDRIMEDFEWNRIPFTLMDTGGIAPEEGPIQNQVSLQSELALGMADLIIFVVDAINGPTKEDIYVAKLLRNARERVILVANKADNKDYSDHNFFILGFGEPYYLSAMSGRNLADLLDIIVDKIKKTTVSEGEETGEEEWIPRITIAGKPNVGKSSLLNQLLGEKRATVSEIAGTTRDAVDTLVDFEGRKFVLVDTAGIRKKYKYDEQLDFVTVKRSEQAIHRSDLCILTIDGSLGVASEDQHLARFIADEGKACIVVLNKIDLVVDRAPLLEHLEHQLRFISYAPVISMSALTGKNTQKLFPTIISSLDHFTSRITTGKFNKWLSECTDKQSPMIHRGKLLKIYYGTQVAAKPPIYELFVNDPEAAAPAYLRFLENQLRLSNDLAGTPVIFRLKERR